MEKPTAFSMVLDFNRPVVTSIVVHKMRSNTERVVPNIYAEVKYYLIFNHEPVRVTVDGESMEFPAYCCTLWDNSHQVYYYGLNKKQWYGSWIFGQEEFIATEIAACGIRLNTPFHFFYEDTALRYFQNIYEECAAYRENDVDIDIIKTWLRALFLELRRIQNNAGAGQLRIPQPLLEARAYIEANLGDPELSLIRIAGRAHLAPNYFSRFFKRYFGVSPIHYLISRRLDLAVRYLRHTELPVREVARLVGYSDHFHFSKLFHQHLGEAPNQVRREPVPVGERSDPAGSI